MTVVVDQQTTFKALDQAALKQAIQSACFEEFREEALPPDMLTKWLADLSHGGRTRVGQPVTKEGIPIQLTWCVWHALEDAQLRWNLAQWMAKRTQELAIDDFDTVCATSPTALPLASLVSTWLGKGLLAVDSFTFHFFPRQPKVGERLLVIDTVVKVGNHLYSAYRQIQLAEAVFAGAVAIAWHDLWDQRLNIVDELIADEQLVFLHSMRPFYEDWQKAPRSARLLEVEPLETC